MTINEQQGRRTMTTKTQVTIEQLVRLIGLTQATAIATYCPPLAVRKTVDGKTIHIMPGSIPGTFVCDVK